jgi:hypothetical protein
MLSKYRLPNTLPDEKVVKIIRKDVFILLNKVLLLLVLIALPLIFFYLFFLNSETLYDNPIVYPLLILGSSAYYLFVWAFFFFSFIDYYLDVWIITNQRIINIEQRGFFSRVISEQKLFRVQDVTSETHGVWSTLLRFGFVYVQTAGAKSRFIFEDVPHPNQVRDTIIKLAEFNKKKMHEEMKMEEKMEQGGIDEEPKRSVL